MKTLCCGEFAPRCTFGYTSASQETTQLTHGAIEMKISVVPLLPWLEGEVGKMPQGLQQRGCLGASAPSMECLASEETKEQLLLSHVPCFGFAWPPVPQGTKEAEDAFWAPAIFGGTHVED